MKTCSWARTDFISILQPPTSYLFNDFKHTSFSSIDTHSACGLMLDMSFDLLFICNLMSFKLNYTDHDLCPAHHCLNAINCLQFNIY